MTFISGLFSVILLISKFQFPPKILCFRVLDTVEDESVIVFETVLNLIHSQRLLCPLSDLNQKPSNIPALSTQLSSHKRHTFRYESDDRHSLLRGVTCWVL